MQEVQGKCKNSTSSSIQTLEPTNDVNDCFPHTQSTIVSLHFSAAAMKIEEGHFESFLDVDRLTRCKTGFSMTSDSWA